MTIDKDQVRKVAHLARLQLTETEEEEFTLQLNSILDYFQQLADIDTTDVPPTFRAVDVSNVMRPDVLVTDSDREALLSEAPDRDGDFFRVPKIMND